MTCVQGQSNVRRHIIDESHHAVPVIDERAFVRVVESGPQARTHLEPKLLGAASRVKYIPYPQPDSCVAVDLT